MKRTFLSCFTVFAALSAFAQTPVITSIIDGDCSGGLPKVIELYADGAVDFSNYTLQKSANGGTFGSDFSLAALGTVEDSFVYIYDDNESTIFEDEFSLSFTDIVSLETNSSAIGFNGDDAIRLVENTTSEVVDQYGIEADGTGTAWEYKDGYATRNPNTVPNGSFNEADWTFNNGGFDGIGLCQGNTSFGSVLELGSYITTSTPIVDCLAPILSDDIIGETEAYITWSTDNVDTVSYEVSLGDAQAVTTDAAEYLFENLTASTTYNYAVRTDCGNGNYSDWTTGTFTTTDATVVTPSGCADDAIIIVTEDFESDTPSWANDVRDFLFVDSSSPEQGLFIEPSRGDYNDSFSGNVLHAQDLLGETSDDNPGYEIYDFTFEEVDVSGYTDVSFGFDYFLDFSNDDLNVVFTINGFEQEGINIVSGDADALTGSFGFTLPPNTESFGFRATGTLNGGNDVVELDNIKLCGVPADVLVCADPTDLSVSDLTETSATFNWVSPGDENAWEIKITEQGSTSNVVEANGTNSQTYDATGLTANTAYTFYVRSICGVDFVSSWTELDFTTLEEVTPEGCVAPSNVMLTNTTPTSLTITFDIPEGAVLDGKAGTAAVQVVNPRDNRLEIRDYDGGSPLTMNNLTPNQDYFLVLRSDCGSDNVDVSPWSEVYTGSTDDNGGRSTFAKKANLYPNPATDVVRVSIKDAQSVVILNTAGNVVSNTRIENNQFNVSNLSAGQYFIQITDKNGNVTVEQLMKK